MWKTLTAIGAAALLSGCAAGPSISELRGGATSATFVQLGREPARYSFGVVDTASFWATYGDSVSSQTGGRLWRDLAEGGQTDVVKRTQTVHEIMRGLYDNHPLADKVSAALMPRVAEIWNLSYDPAKVRVYDQGLFEDKDGNFTAFAPTTDLVVTFGVDNLRLTERFTVGSAVLGGLTMGTNTKKVTAEVETSARVYRRDPATGKYRRVWWQPCGLHSMHMNVDFPFPEVVRSKEKARVLWDAGAAKTIEVCSAGFMQMRDREAQARKGI